jgi:hypothetical protein
MRGGHQLLGVAKAVKHDVKAQKHLKEGVVQLIRDLKLK